jgi:hypothetical protein
MPGPYQGPSAAEQARHCRILTKKRREKNGAGEHPAPSFKIEFSLSRSCAQPLLMIGG